MSGLSEPGLFEPGLFEPRAPQAPLAERLRPKTLEDVVGQSHLLGEGKPLRLAFTSGKLPSMILWGPPGVGKTTLFLDKARRYKKSIKFYINQLLKQYFVRPHFSVGVKHG